MKCPPPQPPVDRAFEGRELILPRYRHIDQILNSGGREREKEGKREVIIATFTCVESVEPRNLAEHCSNPWLGGSV